MVSGFSILRSGAIALLLLVFVQTPASADTHTLGIHFLPMTSCDEVWNWNGCDSKMVDTVFGDPSGAGHCYWIQPVGRIKMYPARLQVDLSTLKGLDTIEVDVNELDYAGRTKVFAYAYGQSSAFVQAASTAGGTQTLQIDVSGVRPVMLAVDCAECEVSEVRLISAGAIVPLDVESFSTVKGMFRAR